jgi:hypothetical protein
MAEVYSSIRALADKIQRHPLMSDLTLESIVNYSVDFMRICGVPKMFLEKVEIIEVDNYRAKLPCDWYQTIQIREKKEGHWLPAIRHSSDSFHMNQDPTKMKHSLDGAFKIQGDIIYTSFESGEIEIAYLALPLDDDGFALIPDNSKYMRALEYYIRKEYFTILFDMGKISMPVLQNTQQQYAFYVGQAQNEFIKLDISKAESLFNGWSALLPRDHSFQAGFGNAGTREYLRIKR